jgi:hypothetical protein
VTLAARRRTGGLRARRLAIGWLCLLPATPLACAPIEHRPAVGEETRDAQPVGGANGVAIEFAHDVRVFPERWRDPPYSARCAPLEYPSERVRVSRAVASGLARYPAGLLASNVRRVVVVRRLFFSGIRAAGTNSQDTVFVACDGESSEFVVETLHHEVSSILLRNHRERFPQDEWTAQNPAGFRYRDSGVAAIRERRDSLEYDAALHEEGFLHQYAQASLEDDFNSICEKLLSGEERFLAIAARRERIAAKARLARRFLVAIEPGFESPEGGGLALATERESGYPSASRDGEVGREVESAAPDGGASR